MELYFGNSWQLKKIVHKLPPLITRYRQLFDSSLKKVKKKFGLRTKILRANISKEY